MKTSRKTILVAVLIPLLLVAHIFAFRHVSAKQFQLGSQESEWFLPEEKYVRLLTIGFNQLAADLFLIDTQVYVADNKDKFVEHNCRILNNKLNLIARLDPKLEENYIYGGFVLPKYCDQMGVADSNQILKRGWSNLPDNYKMPMMIGFNYLNYSDLNKKASLWFRIASRLPDAPSGLVWVADNLAKESLGDIGMISIQQKLMCEMCATAKDEEQKRHLCNHCKMYKIIVILNEKARLFKEKTGQAITRVNDLVENRLIKYIPKDPTNGKFVIDKNGIVNSTTNLKKNN